MILSEMRPDTIMANSSDLGSREIDQNYDWIGEVRLRYPDLNLADTANFIQQNRELGELGITDDENTANCAVNWQSLNANQMRIFKRIESHYESLLTDPAHVEPLQLIVMGTAGTGKSFLINVIRERLREIARNNNIEA